MKVLPLIVLALAGCATTPRAPKPEIVTVTVTRTIKVPPELTRDCDVVPKQADTYGEAKRLANARKAALDECTGRMRAIRTLGGNR